MATALPKKKLEGAAKPPVIPDAPTVNVFVAAVLSPNEKALGAVAEVVTVPRFKDDPNESGGVDVAGMLNENPSVEGAAATIVPEVGTAAVVVGTSSSSIMVVPPSHSNASAKLPS